MEYILKTNKICKQYKDFYALKDVTINVPKGSIYGLVGQNGAGKTTLLRIISGLQCPTSGNIELFHVQDTCKTLNKLRHKMNGIIETPSLNMSLSVKDNIVAQNIMSGNTMQTTVDELLQSVGLLDAKNKKVQDISLGMRQRLAIAKMMINSPSLLLLDEPMNGLDPKGIVDIRNILLNLNKDFGVTIVISSHILEELSKVATVYGFIDKGKLLQEISADMLPKDLETYFIELIGGKTC